MVREERMMFLEYKKKWRQAACHVSSFSSYEAMHLGWQEHRGEEQVMLN
jgi:hypothetical protein